MVTRGRTRTTVDLSVDTVLRTNPDHFRGRRHGEHRRIVDLCVEPTPLAEIAGRLRQPLQVVSILVGDLLNDQLLERVSGTNPEDHADLQLLEKVLEGLHGL